MFCICHAEEMILLPQLKNQHRPGRSSPSSCKTRRGCCWELCQIRVATRNPPKEIRSEYTSFAHPTEDYDAMLCSRPKGVEKLVDIDFSESEDK